VMDRGAMMGRHVRTCIENTPDAVRHHGRSEERPPEGPGPQELTYGARAEFQGPWVKLFCREIEFPGDHAR
jgi:hypothetical protein